MAEEKKDSKASCLAIFIFSVLIALLLRVCASCDSSEASPTMALAMSRNFVKVKLLSPSTAEFASLSESTITESGNSFYIISYVDAKNVFGVAIRKNYTCRLQYNSNNKTWSLLSLDIE